VVTGVLGRLARENTRKNVCKPPALGRLRDRQLIGRYLAELGEAPFANPHHEYPVAHLDEVNGSARVERQMSAQFQRAAGAAETQATRTPEDEKREAAHGDERDQSLDEVTGVGRQAAGTLSLRPRRREQARTGKKMHPRFARDYGEIDGS
jgi:hypothetical protein